MTLELKNLPEVASTGDATVSLASLTGKKVVLYFYPKDNTPGCTTEGIDFARQHADFAAAGVVVLGVSRDSVKSHEGFKCKYEFPFELLSDADESLCEAFGVIKMKNMYGKQVRGIGKLTPHGALGGAYPTVDACGGRWRILVDLETNVVEQC